MVEKFMNTTLNIRALAAVAALTIAPIGASFAATLTDTVPQASIPFVSFGGINDWQADHDRGLWVQDLHRHWYYATFMGPCQGLNFTNSIGFDARHTDTFDRFSTVIVPGWGKCALTSFTASDPPANKLRANERQSG
jgi:hypothetical protein